MDFFFLLNESVDREEPVDPPSPDHSMGCEGSSSTQGEGNSSIFWDDDQGPVVIVWDGMIPGEQDFQVDIKTLQFKRNMSRGNPVGSGGHCFVDLTVSINYTVRTESDSS